MRFKLLLLALLIFVGANAQQAGITIEQQHYLADLQKKEKTFTDNFYRAYKTIYSLPVKEFVTRIDSARQIFALTLQDYSGKLDKPFEQQQRKKITYYFDRLLADYPVNHDIYTGQTSTIPALIRQRLQGNLTDFNNPALLQLQEFTDYVRAFLYYQVVTELKKPIYKKSDNQQLAATWKLIPIYFSNKKCRSFWQSDFLFNHIDNNGIKNIDGFYKNFMATCNDTAYISKVRAVYAEDAAGRKGHLIIPYKRVSGFDLDMHLFLSSDITNGKKRPVIVFFHGGSWSEGKPDWFFDSCASYAKKGWIAAAVEYRTYARYRTLPFEAVKDAKSAIRWLRQQAGKYGIDTGRIVASGNSAGGHLVLCAALTDNWNESTDNLAFSARPNALLVNSGVYDLTDEITAWIRKDLKNKALVKEISPLYLIKPSMPPALIIHGTNDQNVPYSTASRFVDEMIKAGNKNIDFHSLQGAGHFIWIGPRYKVEMTRLRQEFLGGLGY